MSRKHSTRADRCCVQAISLVIMALASRQPLAVYWPQAVTKDKMNTAIEMTVGGKKFAVTLHDGPAAVAFRRLLPLSIKMEELNGNEKFATLPSKMPTQSSRPSSIRAGELMLYGTDTIVLFYKSFPTTFSYTPIGRLDETGGLEAALGSGNVEVSFSAPQ